MYWAEIKKSIQNDLLSRGLKNPNIRLNALDNIEELLRDNHPKILKDLSLLKKISKAVFKKMLAECKISKKLNSAESSVINEIYYRIGFSEIKSNREMEPTTRIHHKLKQIDKVREALPPVINENTHTLILGTLPSEKSLQKQEYYANPQNQFWRIIFKIFQPNIIPSSYEQKVDLLLKNGLGLWDVLRSATREGSLDENITDESFNDFEDLIKKQPHLERIVFNGKKSANYFESRFSNLDLDISKSILPSTSSANTNLNFRLKVSLWKKALTG